MNTTDQLVIAWRTSSIEPETADDAELELRRKLKRSEDEVAAARATNGDWRTLLFAQEATIGDELCKRIARKADCERQHEIEKLRNYVTCLEARVKALEEVDIDPHSSAFEEDSSDDAAADFIERRVGTFTRDEQELN